MSEKGNLAILGGEATIPPEIKSPYSPLMFADMDKQAVFDFMEHQNTLSYYSGEGIQTEYENTIETYFNVKHCVLTNSGTSALHSAYFALGLQPGDEVIVPVYTFFATVTPLFTLGIRIILSDCEPITGNIDIKAIEANISPSTKAICVTHMWGHPANMPAIKSLADKYDLIVIEDISLSVGARINGQLVGTFGDIACFSLGSTKMLSGGQGGALITNNTVYRDRAILLGHFGKTSKSPPINPYYHKFSDIGYGHNYRMHVLAMAISKKRFESIDTLIEKRHQRYNLLKKILNPISCLTPPQDQQNIFRGIWHGFNVTYDENITNIPIELFTSALQKEGLDVKCKGHFPLLHTTKYFSTQSDGYYGTTKNIHTKTLYKKGDFPAAEQHVNSQIFFPLFLNEPIDFITLYGKACEKVANNCHILKGKEANAL